MKIEIDQSGKIEKTSKHTYLAYSNGDHFVLKISAVEKQKLERYFRKINRRKTFVLFTLSALLAILIKQTKVDCDIIIDQEYPGKQPVIKHYLKIITPEIAEKHISVKQIGKKSRAHFYAHGAAIKKIKPDLVLTANDILKVIKKSGNA